ncbi:MAG: SLC13/DASS family transporter [Magnetococcales bacterium]|nr:SLC13/DASS family transporter [Magnetococcales bacterium]
MTSEAWLAVAMIVFCVLLLAANRYPASIVLSGGVVALLGAGLITPRQALAGFINEGMITVGVLYVVVAGLQQTGAIGWMVDSILGIPRSIRHAQWRMALPVAAISPFINNTPVVAMFTPAISAWARRHQIPLSQLMIPLAFLTTASGLCTLVGSSTNLIVHALLRDKAESPGFSFWELGWIGIPVTITVFLYTVYWSNSRLPDRVADCGFPDDLSGSMGFRRMLLALAILLGFVLLATIGHVSTLRSALIAAGLMLITGCVSVTTAWRAVEWPILLVIATSFALGTALDTTGAAQSMASALIVLTRENVLVSLAMVYMVTALLTQIVTNNATAALMFPIALATARDLQVSVMPFAVVVLVASSASFVTPIGYQTNLMVQQPGGYRFLDYIRFGWPLSLLVAGVTLGLTPLIWSF